MLYYKSSSTNPLLVFNTQSKSLVHEINKSRETSSLRLFKTDCMRSLGAHMHAANPITKVTQRHIALVRSRTYTFLVYMESSVFQIQFIHTRAAGVQYYEQQSSRRRCMFFDGVTRWHNLVIVNRSSNAPDPWTSMIDYFFVFGSDRRLSGDLEIPAAASNQLSKRRKRDATCPNWIVFAKEQWII